MCFFLPKGSERTRNLARVLTLRVQGLGPQTYSTLRSTLRVHEPLAHCKKQNETSKQMLVSRELDCWRSRMVSIRRMDM